MKSQRYKKDRYRMDIKRDEAKRIIEETLKDGK